VPISVPNLTLLITPPGGSPTNYTTKMAWSGAANQMTISQNFGRQGDTAVIPLVDDWQGQAHPNFYIPVLSQVSLFDNIADQYLFAGVVNDPVLSVTGPNRNEWTLNCTDYTFYADNSVVAGQFYGLTADQIIISLVAQANCGISAAAVRNGGFVAPGPALSSFILNYSTLSDAWRNLSTLAGQVTPYGWYVDQNRALHFYDASSAIDSGVTFTTTPTQGGSTTQGHILLDGQFGYEWDGTSIRNKILVQGANQPVAHGTVGTTTPTGSWRGDGTTSTWGLRFTVTGSPVLRVNGVTTAVTVFQAGDTGTTPTGWIVTQNSVGGWYLGNSAAPANGTLIQLWYDYQFPIIAQASDLPSQATYTGPNSGIYEEYINDTSLVTTPMALARAQRERQEYAFAAERITFNTSEDFLGWVRAGETCTVVTTLVPDSASAYSWGLDDTFIVIGNSVNFQETGGYRQCQITAIRI
jgi:hypothetical protein